MIKENIQWVIEHKDYAPLYSSLIVTGALLFSVLSFVFFNIVSKNRVKREKIISDTRYEEQRKQYEERINEERKRREEDKKEAEGRLRVSEEPYFVFKNSKIVSDSNSEQTILHMEFLNKGRGVAYCINPDLECTAKRMDMSEFTMRRYEAVQDPIAMLGEIFVMVMNYDKSENDIFGMTPTIKFEDASGREYKQTFCIDIGDRWGNGTIINYAQPELCKD